MDNLIDNKIKNKPGLKIMTHIVAGYPDFETNLKMVKLMEDCGVDLIEIQIPFSDPLADGKTIMIANQAALDKNILLSDCFDLISKIKEVVSIPIIIMSYANIPYRFGLNKFILKCQNLGVSGLILPDLPFDEDNEDYIKASQSYSIHPIQVISSDISMERLSKICGFASGFIYSTLKVGITGAMENMNQDGLSFLSTIREKTELPIAAGFGISSIDHIKLLKNKADIAIIGSYIMNLYNSGGLIDVKKFLMECREEILKA
jgi:tryptophan synthase alpha chain